jgi:hypothetical protein
MTEVLERRFAAIGARVKVAGPARGAPRIDIGSDGRGEFFDVRFTGSGGAAGLEVVVDFGAEGRIRTVVPELSFNSHTGWQVSCRLLAPVDAGIIVDELESAPIWVAEVEALRESGVLDRPADS